ncbi:MAG: CAP domain-containing protein [Pseudomonadota bacterium]
MFLRFKGSHGLAAFCGLAIACAPQSNTSSTAETAAPTPAAGIQVADAGPMAGVLALHNRLRAQHCVPALAWSDRLAQTAQAWADRCVFEHSNGNLGENLASGTAGAFSPESHVQSWYDEISSYDFATGQSRDGQAVGHFTQVIWAETTQVGCGWARCGGEEMLVCNYAPAGNFIGQEAQNVPQQCR